MLSHMFIKVFRSVILLSTCLFLLACEKPVEIYHPKSQKTLNFQSFIEALEGSDFIFLGEYHDQKSHHLFRAQVIEALGKKQKGNRVVGFEHIKQKEQEILLNFKLSRPDKTHLYVDELAESLKWQDSGWGDWSLFRSLFQASYKSGFYPQGLNLSFDLIKDVVKRGKEALEEEFYKRSGLSRPLEKASYERLKQAVIEGHCHKLPVDYVDSFVFAQRVRDAFMSDQALKTQAVLAEKGKVSQGVFLIGNAHARKDYGMPWYFSQRGFTKHVTVGLFSYEEKDTEQIHSYDYVVFLPFQDRADPCKNFKP